MLDMYFLDLRCHLLEAAAGLDRIERAEGGGKVFEDPRILKLEEGKPVLAISSEEAKKGKCTECLACEIFCRFHEQDAITIHLPIPGLKEYRERIIKNPEK